MFFYTGKHTKLISSHSTTQILTRLRTTTSNSESVTRPADELTAVTQKENQQNLIQLHINPLDKPNQDYSQIIQICLLYPVWPNKKEGRPFVCSFFIISSFILWFIRAAERLVVWLLSLRPSEYDYGWSFSAEVGNQVISFDGDEADSFFHIGHKSCLRAQRPPSVTCHFGCTWRKLRVIFDGPATLDLFRQLFFLTLPTLPTDPNRQFNQLQTNKLILSFWL